MGGFGIIVSYALCIVILAAAGWCVVRGIKEAIKRLT